MISKENDSKISSYDKSESVKDPEKYEDKKETEQKFLEPVEESIFPASVSDQVARTDGLGFEPYVQAVADFLTHPDTEPPLTISVEGQWGTGKSSFMAQLEKKLKGRNELTINFNAWRHDKEEALWAAFALEFIQQISRKCSFVSRCWIHLKLLYYRSDWKNGRLNLLSTLSIWVLIISATIVALLLLVLKGFEWITSFSGGLTDYTGQDNNELLKAFANSFIGLGGFAGIIGVSVSLWIKLKNFVGNPLDIDLNKYIQSPDYENRISFIENFHRDFSKIVDAYAGNRKVYVFIDDLDRCDVPKAPDLMQAINLMISSDPRLIFIIGMDREKIAAGIAVKHKEILPYIFSGRNDEISSSSYAETFRGIEYGYAFIEKFIQLPFLIPQPAKPEIQQFLLNISKKDDKTETKESQQHYKNNLSDEQKKFRETIRFKVTEDSKTIRDVALMVSPALDNNPRRLKQFINLFRLRTFIANETGLFDVSDESFQDESLTLEQLGKFVAICLKWPLLIGDLEKNRNLLAELQYLSIRKSFDDEKSPGSQIKIFSWNEINNTDRIPFLEYMSTRFGIYWIENANIIYVTDREINAAYGNNFLKLILDNDQMNATKAYLNIDENFKKQNEKFIVRWENNTLNVYKNISDKGLYWSRQEKLTELLSFGEPAHKQGQKYNISKLNIDKLLQVSPKVARNVSAPKDETVVKNSDIDPQKIQDKPTNSDQEGDYDRWYERYEERGPRAGPPPKMQK